ncbi:MAG: PIN domain-containing protein [Methanobrevibacter sp.]|jgi:predicted nucleic acid-binding protein|nr:PIN domain-containing protein [Methanobrevibacter sp.]
MNLNEKIVLVIDTNIFYQKKFSDFTKLPLEKYYKTIESIKQSKIEENIDIYFPEIVLAEMIIQSKKSCKKELRDSKVFLNKLKNLSTIQYELYGFDLDTHFEEIEKNHKKELNIIENSISEEKMKEIYKMALEKIPPFVEGKSDKGFKDAIIYLSLIDFAKKTEYDEYIIISKDKGFKQGKLISNFKNRTGKKLEVINKELSIAIEEKFGLFKDLRKYINNELYNEIKDKRVWYDDCPTKDGLLYTDCEFISLNKEKTEIYRLNDSSYEVKIHINMKCHDYCSERHVPLIKECGRNDSLNVSTIELDRESIYILEKKEDEWKIDYESSQI